MFKERNLSPKQLALLTALLMSSLIALSVFVLIANWKLLLAYFVACFIVIYLLVNQILELFIYRKIKLIYKLISYTKASKREEAFQKYLLPRKGIDEVREDVENWAAQKVNEIQQLQSNEQFRKEFLQKDKTKKIVSLLEKGKSVRDISSRLGVSTKTIVKVRKYVEV